MNLSQEQIDAILAQSVPDVVEAFKKELTRTVEWTVAEQARSEISNAVTEWVKTNIVPELVTELEASKNGLLRIGPKLAEQVVSQLAESMCAELKKKLEQSWERKKIFDSLFC